MVTRPARSEPVATCSSLASVTGPSNDGPTAETSPDPLRNRRSPMRFHRFRRASELASKLPCEDTCASGKGFIGWVTKVAHRTPFTLVTCTFGVVVDVLR